jgi:hypothetical protein
VAADDRIWSHNLITGELSWLVVTSVGSIRSSERIRENGGAKIDHRSAVSVALRAAENQTAHVR